MVVVRRPGVGGPDARGRNVSIRRCETGHAYLNWIVNGARGSIENFVVEDNIAYTAMTVNGAGPAGGDRGTNWHIRRNRGQLRQGRGRIGGRKDDPGGRAEDRRQLQQAQSHTPGIDLGTSTDVKVAPTETPSSPSSREQTMGGPRPTAGRR